MLYIIKNANEENVKTLQKVISLIHLCLFINKEKGFGFDFEMVV